MKSGAASRIDILKDLCRFAKAIERRGNRPFTQPELAVELKISTRTVTRYLKIFRDQLDLVVATPENRMGSAVIGKWRFLDAVAAYYKRGA